MLGDAALADGRHSGFADGAIAAIARSRELAILTLICGISVRSGVDTLNPFNAV